MASKIRKGDLVQVMRGRDRDQRGRVVRVDSVRDRVWVEGVNMISRHRKGVAGQTESTIEKKEAPLHLSNVMLVDPQDDGPTRIKMGVNKDGKKVRIAAKSGAVLDG